MQTAAESNEAVPQGGQLSELRKVSLRPRERTATNAMHIALVSLYLGLVPKRSYALS